jgi:hypothetical protein
MAEIIEKVDVWVRHVAQDGDIYLQSNSFDADIELKPRQVRCAGFNPHKVRNGRRLVVDVRIENDGRLKTSLIRSVDGKQARRAGSPR